MKVIAWLIGFVILFIAFMSAAGSGNTGWASVVFIFALLTLGPGFNRLKKRAFVLGYTGKRNPSPEETEKAEKVEKLVGRAETAHKIYDLFK